MASSADVCSYEENLPIMQKAGINIDKKCWLQGMKLMQAGGFGPKEIQAPSKLMQKITNIRTKFTSIRNHTVYQMERLEAFRKKSISKEAPFIEELNGLTLQMFKDNQRSQAFLAEYETGFWRDPNTSIKALTEIELSMYQNISQMIRALDDELRMLAELIGIVSSSKSLDIVQSSLDFVMNILGQATSPYSTQESLVSGMTDVLKQNAHTKKNNEMKGKIDRHIIKSKNIAHIYIKRYSDKAAHKSIDPHPFFVFREGVDDPVINTDVFSKFLTQDLLEIFTGIANLKTFEEEEETFEEEKKAHEEKEKTERKREKNKAKKNRQKQNKKIKDQAEQLKAEADLIKSSETLTSFELNSAAPASITTSSSGTVSGIKALGSEKEKEEDEEEDQKEAASSSSSSADQPSKKAFIKMEEEKAQQQKQIKRQEFLKDLISKAFSPLYNTVDWADWNKALKHNGYMIEQQGNGKKSYINGTTGKRFAVENAHGEGSNKFSLANIGVIRAFCLSQGLVPSGMLPDHMIQPWLKGLQA